MHGLISYFDSGSFRVKAAKASNVGLIAGGKHDGPVDIVPGISPGNPLYGLGAGMQVS